MARMTTAQAWANNWATKMSNAAGSMTTGANGVIVAPGELATAPDKVAKMKTRWNARVDDGSWAQATRAVTKDEWARKYIAKGIPNAMTAIPVAKPNVQSFAASAIPVFQAAQAMVKAMPKATRADSLARVGAWMDAMQTAAAAGAFHTRRA